jgi:hypothetical protein
MISSMRVQVTIYEYLSKLPPFPVLFYHNQQNQDETESPGNSGQARHFCSTAGLAKAGPAWSLRATCKAWACRLTKPTGQ